MAPLGAFLQQECMNKQLAYALLKHPTAVVNTLLEWWAQYLASPEYQREARRAQKVDGANAHVVNKKRGQVKLKIARASSAGPHSAGQSIAPPPERIHERTRA